MSYLSQSRHASPTSMAAVVAIHAGVGVLLVTGLTISGVIAPPDGPLIVIDPYEAPPPPKPEKPIEPKAAAKPTPEVFVPTPVFPLVPQKPDLATSDKPLLDPMPRPSDTGTAELVLPKADPVPGLAPVGAKPRNDPGRWLTNDDYRPAWVRQELTGTAKFRLEIAANGKVSGCTVIGSTGHAALDEATCALVAKRAKFEPARGTQGEAVGGSYTGSVRWRLPE